MNISIKKDNGEQIKGIVSFDINGNAYVDISKHFKFNNLFQICVDGENKPYCDPGDYTILDNTIPKFGNMFNSENKEEENSEDEDSDKEEEVVDDYVRHDPYCNISEKYYYEEKDTLYNLNDDHYDDSKFHFCSLTLAIDIPVVDRLNGDILSLYDTFLYQDNNNVFRSKLVGEAPLYILKLHESGSVYFRNICNRNTETEYSFSIDKENNLKIV